MNTKPPTLAIILFNIRQTTIRCFKIKNLIGVASMVVITAFVVRAGLDWRYYQFIQALPVKAPLFAAAMIGAVLPIVAPLLLYALGRNRNDRATIELSATLGQAAILGSFLSSLGKAISGRVAPRYPPLEGVIDSSHIFNIGFFKEGIFWGWPSSHTTIAFAMAIAFIGVSGRVGSSRWSALVYALFIAFGVSFGIHWLSDVLAGAILGIIIGREVVVTFSNHNRFSKTL